MSETTRAQLQGCVDFCGRGWNTIYVTLTWQHAAYCLNLLADVHKAEIHTASRTAYIGGQWIRLATVDSEIDALRGLHAGVVFDHHAMSNVHLRRVERWMEFQKLQRKYQT